MKVEGKIVYGGDYNKKFNHHSLGHFIISSLVDGGDHEVLINGATGKVWTHADILEQTIKFAKSFVSAGVRRSDRIAIISENRHEVAAISFAAMCIHAIIAPINFSYTERKIMQKYS
jgi:acyl-CoA synthetase (AMP-forming)/AMP-acid ligase II